MTGGGRGWCNPYGPLNAGFGPWGGPGMYGPMGYGPPYGGFGYGAKGVAWEYKT